MEYTMAATLNRARQGLARFIVAVIFAGVSACATNPVTGKTELFGMSGAQEVEIGEQNYAPMRQSSGGDYDIDPGLTEYVQGVGNRLAAVSDRELPYEFSVLNSSVPNAWALPGGKIAINRGLLTEMGSEAELAAVLGHEVVHAAAGHTSQRAGRGQLLQILVLGTAIATADSKYGNYAVGGASLGSQLINQQYSQGDELESDKYGMRYMSRAGYDPQGAVALQKTFLKLSEGRRSDWLSGLFASHPPSQKRVDENIQTASRLPPGGELGVERYKAAMAKTIEVKPAYDAYDEGMKALADDNPDLAVAKAEEAIGILPEEGHFYMLRGLARASEGQYDSALTNFNSAIRRRDDYFQYYLWRGQTYAAMDNYDEAVNDLQKSNSMLPTAQAFYYLGAIAAKRGDRRAAIENFSKVAGDNNQLARSARDELAKLELSDHPEKYVYRRCDPGSDGKLIVSIKNATSLDIAGIAFAVDYTDSEGRTQRYTRTLNGVLGAGRVVEVNTQLGPYAAGSNCPVQITAARVYER
ncbi:MAG: M48 family metalloprotease [Gammaproteobacteria bacterium]|nr:M48 family metalloprotease [Gammaproteobacteria bacterium]